MSQMPCGHAMTVVAIFTPQAAIVLNMNTLGQKRVHVTSCKADIENTR